MCNTVNVYAFILKIGIFVYNEIAKIDICRLCDLGGKNHQTNDSIFFLSALYAPQGQDILWQRNCHMRTQFHKSLHRTKTKLAIFRTVIEI